MAEVVGALTGRGASVECRETPHRAAAVELVSACGPYDAVIAAGGDGTVRALAPVLSERGIALGVLPLGTGNVLAHEIGAPREAGALADMLMGGPQVEIVGARANGEPFFLMAGVGFDGDVLNHLNTGLKRRVGKAAYGWPILKALARTIPTLDVIIDGRRTTAGWVIAANAKHYAGSFVVAPDATLLRSGLFAILFKARDPVARLRGLMALAAGRLHRTADVEIVPCTRLAIAAAEPVAAEIDGDPFGTTPLDIEVGGPSLKLIVPQAFLDRARDPAMAAAAVR